MQGLSLKQTQLISPLSNQAVIRPKGHSGRRLMVSSLLLTSLVDAFSILVIFLLMSTQNGIEIELKKTEKLPVATQVDSLEKSIVLRIEDGSYFIGEKQVSESRLSEALNVAKTEFEKQLGSGAKAGLIVQADKQMNFEELSPVLTAGSQAGLSQFKFAAIGARER